MIRRLAAFLLCLGVIISACPPSDAGPIGSAEIRVAAAADLQKAFTELAARFEKRARAKVSLVFGSTGLLTKQIENGAPFDLLAAADEGYVADLEKRGHVVPGTRALYAVGTLVIWTRGRPSRTIQELAGPAYRRIAIANPAHAPYGVAARDALQKAGVWQAVQPKLVYGENVRETLQYAQTGNADSALVALSLAIDTPGRYSVVPAALHRPLRQALCVLNGGSNPDLARRFAAFINGPDGRPIMRKYGFSLPGEKAK